MTGRERIGDHDRAQEFACRLEDGSLRIFGGNSSARREWRE